jgi:hypothetical protein
VVPELAHAHAPHAFGQSSSSLDCTIFSERRFSYFELLGAAIALGGWQQIPFD